MRAEEGTLTRWAMNRRYPSVPSFADLFSRAAGGQNWQYYRAWYQLHSPFSFAQQVQQGIGMLSDRNMQATMSEFIRMVREGRPTASSVRMPIHWMDMLRESISNEITDQARQDGTTENIRMGLFGPSQARVENDLRQMGVDPARVHYDGVINPSMSIASVLTGLALSTSSLYLLYRTEQYYGFISGPIRGAYRVTEQTAIGAYNALRGLDRAVNAVIDPDDEMHDDDIQGQQEPEVYDDPTDVVTQVLQPLNTEVAYANWLMRPYRNTLDRGTVQRIIRGRVERYTGQLRQDDFLSLREYLNDMYPRATPAYLPGRRQQPTYFASIPRDFIDQDRPNLRDDLWRTPHLGARRAQQAGIGRQPEIDSMDPTAALAVAGPRDFPDQATRNEIQRQVNEALPEARRNEIQERVNEALPGNQNQGE